MVWHHMDRDPFEFPQHLRELTETNVGQARAAYAQFVDAMTQAMSLWLNAMPQNEMTAGFKLLSKNARSDLASRTSRRVSTLQAT